MKIDKVVLIIVVLLISNVGCGMQKTENNDLRKMVQLNRSVINQQEREIKNMAQKADYVFEIDTNITYQTIESFGTSGAWWSQYVGGWDNLYNDTGIEVREWIAKLLFDSKEGIGLTAYRYNLGAGSKESGKGIYWDEYRRAENFETASGVYDWTKDANAQWLLNRAIDYGVEEVTLFCNSPIERLTINKMAQVTEGERSNISIEKYDEFANYVFNVTEHFVEEGIPVKFVSPINEPQWDWYEGQEGCHYEVDEIVGVYTAFL